MTETADLLFELGTEELPPTALLNLSAAFCEQFISGLEKHNLDFDSYRAIASPRRLGIYVSNCSVQQPDRNTEKRGPAVKAAFDSDGNPTRAALGFASSCGTTVEQLQRTATEKGEWLSFNLNEKGQSAAAVLPGIAEQALEKLPVPKRMRWGESDALFVRPAHWLLFMLGENRVECQLLGLQSDVVTHGHRFHHPDSIKINHPQNYFTLLHETGRVFADFSERKALINQQIKDLSEELQANIPADADLLDEVTALVEWPVALVGSFDKDFLQVPHEALILSMKKNQKYFPVFDQQNNLSNLFITIANIASTHPDSVRAGNERVIRPRLADAKFFWEQDAKTTLEQRLPLLEPVIFQNQLGSLHDKSERVAQLSGFIAGLLKADQSLARRAGLLSRCDLITEMVGEFADMQGTMGRYQAVRDGEPAEVSNALEEMYQPRFSGDSLPSTPIGIALALADRFDTLTGIFGIGQKPSGTKDPFALRRASLGIIRIIRHHQLKLDFTRLISQAIGLHGGSLSNPDTARDVIDYLVDRLKGEFLEQGYSTLQIKAVAAVQPVSIVDFEERLKAVDAFSNMPESASLSAANKRIANILKKSQDKLPAEIDIQLFDCQEESSLMDIISQQQKLIDPLVAGQDYAQILQQLATLKKPVDDFFDNVMVMHENQQVRLNRLALLSSVRRLFLLVADISTLQEN